MAMDNDLLEEIVDFVFDGVVDPREVYDFAKMNDSSEVHVNSAEWKKKRRDVNIGLANNAFGAAAGTIATGQAYKEARKMSPKSMKKSRVGRLLLKTKIKPSRAVPIAGAALVGTQLANGAMDAQSAGYFAKERIRMNKTKKSTVKKNIDHIVNLRRLGQITTEQAIAMAEEIEKSYIEWRPVTPDEMKRHKLDPKKTWTANKSGHDQQFPGSKPYFETENPKVGKPVSATGVKVKRFSTNVGGEETVQKHDNRMSTTPRIISPDPVRDVSGIDVGWSGSISKVDTDKRQVFGWCSVTEVDGEKIVDRQGDFIPLEEVEKSAYNYVIHSRKGGDMHKRDGEQPLHTSDMIESFVVTPEKLENLGLERDALPHGWWVGFKVNDDDQWEEVKKGDRVSFSIHGKGRRVEKHL